MKIAGLIDIRFKMTSERLDRLTFRKLQKLSVQDSFNCFPVSDIALDGGAENAFPGGGIHIDSGAG